MGTVEHKVIAEVLGGRKVFGKSAWSSLLWTAQIERGFPFDAPAGKFGFDPRMWK